MNMQQKTLRAGGSKGFESKNYENAGANCKPFDGLNNNPNSDENQELCGICRPTLEKRHNAPQICDNCKTKADAEALAFIQPAKVRKVIKLELCAGCGNSLASPKFSRNRLICRKCVGDVKTKGKLAKSNFIERTLNNLRRNLGGALNG